MWYDHLGTISIGEQVGGPDDGGLGDIKIDLWRLFVRHCRSSYCPSVAHYAIALRVNGESHNFGNEGIERIRHNRRQRFIGVDIVIPENVWRNSSRNELRDYLARQVIAAIQLCLSRLQKNGDVVDGARLFEEINTAIMAFKKIDYESEK